MTGGKLAHVYHFDTKAKVAEYVRELGIPATFFLPGCYLSNFPGRVFRKAGASEPWTLSLPVPGDTAQVPIFDTRDTGKFVKAIVRQGARVLGHDVYGATAYVTPQQLVDQFRAAFPEAGRDARYVQAPDEAYVAGLKAAGLPAFAAQELLENMHLLDQGGYYGGASLDASQAILEDPLTTWEEFMKTAPAFKDLK